VRGRLGFEPRFIVGSHGAEDGLDASAAAARAGALNPVRDLLRTRGADLAAAGVGIEDKGPVHRPALPAGARAGARAHAHPGSAGAQPGLSVQVFAGKMVVNVMAPDAPDKADAVHALVARCGAASAIFAGDDVNDEPVFVSAPPDWLTVRIGRDHPASRARYFLDSPAEMAMLLERMLVLLARIDAS
jgi:trehalose 6-phosphate phosphatase